MRISYTKQFIKDTKKYPQYKNLIKKVISNFTSASSISEISNIKKLQSDEKDYRLRIGIFRIGFSIVEDTIVI